MNAHRKNEEQLSAYLDGQVSPAQAERIEHALAQDERLARQLAELREVRRLARDMPRHRAPGDFVSNVLGRAERAHLVLPHSADDRGFSWARHLVTAAVVLLAAGIGGVVGVTLWNTARMPTMRTASIRSESAGSSQPAAGRSPELVDAPNQSRQFDNDRRSGSANESQRQNASVNNHAMLITINLRAKLAGSLPATSQPAGQSQSATQGQSSATRESN